jgi:hypothetical protein
MTSHTVERFSVNRHDLKEYNFIVLHIRTQPSDIVIKKKNQHYLFFLFYVSFITHILDSQLSRR